MPVRIKVLPEDVANKIAAGEVVERPASVVKELAENALDAGAGRVLVEVVAGGARLISVSDDGAGMCADDALLCLERHSTSKITGAGDLANISTMGFRGEALPSIASVSRMRITTSETEGGPGVMIVAEGGRLLAVREAGAPKGTSVEVRDLFFNTPARKKFLKSVNTEFGHIASIVERLALSNPGVHFRLTHDTREALDCPPVRDARERVAQVYGRGFLKGLVEVSGGGEVIVSGFVSSPGVTYSGRGRQEVFVNGRPVKSPAVTRALYDAYQSLLMKGRHPAAVIYIVIDPSAVDVNVHPAKSEVRFADNAAVHAAVAAAVAEALRRTEGTPLEASVREGFQPYHDRVRQAAEDYAASAGGDPPRDYISRNSLSPRQETLGFRREPAQSTGSVRGTEQPAFPRPELMQVADSYIVVPEEGGYIVVDQHAAHERVQYERIKKRMAEHGGGSQGLLVPKTLELTAKEAALMEAVIPELKAMGIEAEHFGGTTYVIRSKPVFMDKTDVSEAVTEMLAELEDKDVRSGAGALTEKLCQLMACKSAVKAGQRLHPQAMDRLVRQLFSSDMPQTCAHGRPTFIRFTLDELERMFKRK